LKSSPNVTGGRAKGILSKVQRSGAPSKDARIASVMPTDRQVALLLAVAAFVLYAITAAPSVATQFDDSLEFQVVLPTLGIAHPSGYPLYTLAGKLFTGLLPLRDAAGRANLFSALLAAAAVGVLYRVARTVAGSRAAAIVTTVVFAISPTWWSQATIAEVYALHGLLAVTFVYLLLRWEAVRQSERGRVPAVRPSDRLLALAALAAGLGLAHHRMIALFFPAAFVFILWTDPALLRQPRRWLRPLALLLAPLLLYAYLPIRGQVVSSLDGTYQPTLRGTLDWVLARGYSVFLTGNPFGVTRGAGDYVALFLREMGALTALAAVAGLVTGWRYSPRRSVFLLLALAGQTLFAVNYKVQDVEVFLLPAFMLMAVWAAWGLAPLCDSFAQRAAVSARPLRLPRQARPLLTFLWLLPVALVLLFEPVRAAVREWPQRDRSDEWTVYDLGADMLDSAEPHGVIVGLGGETTLVRYFRDVLGRRPDLQVVWADAEDARLAAVAEVRARGAPVYLTRDLPGAAALYSLDAAGPLVAVSPKATPGAIPSGADVGGGVRWLAGRTRIRQTHAGPVVRVAVEWTAAAPVTEDLKVSARLLDAAGAVVVADDRVPVHFTYPTPAWVPGEVVEDVYDLALPADRRGAFGVLLIVYRAADGSEVGRVELPAVQVD